MVFVLIPFDTTSKATVLKRCQVEPSVEMYTGKELDSVILVSYTGTAYELSQILQISTTKTSCMIVGMDQMSGYGPIPIKDWVENIG